MTAARKLLVTSALPYANGPIHIGHLVEYVQTDIWCRFMRSQGHECLYLCADDAHGAPIMLKAMEEGITPEALVAQVGQEHRNDFADFFIAFDNYYTTHSDENRQLAEDIYTRLEAAGHIARYPVLQAYDPDRGMFLADRYIRGTCPRCGATDQYGDSCEVCGATYSPRDLIEPRSSLTGAVPEWRESEHYFFQLNHFEDFLREWLADDRLQPAVANKIGEWFVAGLRDWDISRDAPYFGFSIPGAAGKYFYVWLDAPIGYMASFWHLLKGQGEVATPKALRERWAEHEIVHFIGKDILYFHTLFWPAMLHGAGYRTPDRVYAHGFLTVDGQKMSKSRGTFIAARTWLDHLPAQALRYYLAAKLTSGIDDLDLNLEDFAQRVNADLVGKLVNIASRTAGFITKGFDGMLGQGLDEPALYHRFVEAQAGLAASYEAREFGRVVRDIMALADEANQYVARRQPWALKRAGNAEAEVQAVCTTALNLFRVLMTYLAPILPEMAAQVAAFFRQQTLPWDGVHEPLLNRPIEVFEPLMSRVEPAALTQLREAASQSAPAA